MLSILNGSQMKRQLNEYFPGFLKIDYILLNIVCMIKNQLRRLTYVLTQLRIFFIL